MHPLRPAEGETRPCPQCQSTLVFSRHYAVLAVGMALTRLGSEAGDRIRYKEAWAGRNGGCDSREIVGDA
jgi:hypothetical protein